MGSPNPTNPEWIRRTQCECHGKMVVRMVVMGAFGSLVPPSNLLSRVTSTCVLRTVEALLERWMDSFRKERLLLIGTPRWRHLARPWFWDQIALRPIYFHRRYITTLPTVGRSTNTTRGFEVVLSHGRVVSWVYRLLGNRSPCPSGPHAEPQAFLCSAHRPFRWTSSPRVHLGKRGRGQ